MVGCGSVVWGMLGVFCLRSVGASGRGAALELGAGDRAGCGSNKSGGCDMSDSDCGCVCVVVGTA